MPFPAGLAHVGVVEVQPVDVRVPGRPLPDVFPVAVAAGEGGVGGPVGKLHGTGVDHFRAHGAVPDVAERVQRAAGGVFAEVVAPAGIGDQPPVPQGQAAVFGLTADCLRVVVVGLGTGGRVCGFVRVDEHQHPVSGVVREQVMRYRLRVVDGAD